MKNPFKEIAYARNHGWTYKNRKVPDGEEMAFSYAIVKTTTSEYVVTNESILNINDNNRNFIEIICDGKQGYLNRYQIEHISPRYALRPKFKEEGYYVNELGQEVTLDDDGNEIILD